MLSKPNDSGAHPVAMNHSVGRSMGLQAQLEASRDAYDALYPVDQLSSANEAQEESIMILWGDVSIQARHPSRIKS